jgi:predicted naringenin-chalcone synthase
LTTSGARQDGLRGLVTGAVVGGLLAAVGVWFRYGPGVGLDPAIDRLVLGGLGLVGLAAVAWAFLRAGPLSGLLTLLIGLVSAAVVIAVLHPPLIG